MYLKLARALASLGIATVRYDKRGLAASHAAVRTESDLRFEMLVDDAAGWIAKLRADKRFSRVTVMGHSEGALAGMLAAQRQAPDAYVSLEGAGFPAPDLLRAQVKDRLPPDLAVRFEAILSALSDGRTVADVPAPLMPVFRPSVQPYLMSWFKFHPALEIAKLRGPVMIVQGLHDVQVPIENGLALANGQRRAAYVTIDALTHVLTDDPGTTPAAQLTGAYADAGRPIDATLVRALVMEATASA
jgi:pimeloyl-ACP methyl ester carboxylesterase